MKLSLEDRLLKRELGNTERSNKVRGLYGDRRWIRDLDIVDELGGHSGCVNALSWSKSGRLLASGSDDQHINLHAYQPDSSTSQFAFTTSVATGHTANIFSVKFMPHSNDCTLITAAGDGEVRIFDLNHAGGSTTTAGGTAATTSSRRRSNFHLYSGVRYLSEVDCNAKVYRSHSDRVKRIVTESSPHLFLTCSEDGEVRQWDLRQPSSAYPPASGRRRFGRAAGSNDDVPPPLISYKRYEMDLNTISCSGTQPHYIALGGAHLHCFLHDRRMLGRDRLAERGASARAGSSPHDDELMNQATHCVRKFAPNGQKKMRRTDNGHITACKISDHNPNEMVVSWSGDHIYSFDLIRSPDASEEQQTSDRVRRGSSHSALKVSPDRKRKRPKATSTTSIEGAARGESRQRTQEGTPEMALRVQYENGQSEDIPIQTTKEQQQERLAQMREQAMTESERQSYRLAGRIVRLRRQMFTLSKTEEPSGSNPTGYNSVFTEILGSAAAMLPEIDKISREWRYPVNPDRIEVEVQKKFKRNRGSVRRFVQATGTIARVLGGQLRTASASGQSPYASYFSKIVPAPSEGLIIERHEHFGYDFIKAILLWLDSGVGAVLEAFAGRAELILDLQPRLPIPPGAGADAMDDVLIPYLLRLASDTKPIIKVDASRFEVDENRVIFPSEKAAVIAFAQAVKIPFADLSSALVPASTDGSSQTTRACASAQDRRAALRFWGMNVARGVLMNAGEGVNFTFVDRAFGGLGQPDAAIRQEERSLQTAMEEINPAENEMVAETVEVIRPGTQSSQGEGTDEDREVLSTAVIREAMNEARAESSQQVATGQMSGSESDENDDDEIAVEVEEDSEVEEGEEENEDEDEEDDDNNGGNDEDSDDDDDSDGDDFDPTDPRMIFRRATGRSRLRTRIDEDVPCSSHTQVYKGHCNVRTVKDVNYFGLQDEYVVSGSDSGHLFIWDKASGQILNILEGDGEVVNVVQGHPYEPMLAVSGIDHTIKIFSPNHLARANARAGVDIDSSAGTSGHSSLGAGRSRLGMRRSRRSGNTTDPEADPAAQINSFNSDSDEPLGPNGLASRRRIHQEYQITSENDENRRGGNREAFITVNDLIGFLIGVSRGA